MMKLPTLITISILFTVLPAFAARGPVADQRIDLGPLGYTGQPSNAQMAAEPMMSLHYVGDHHLLVTFPVRKLMKRLADSLPDDQDRTIAAVLLEMPGGREVARTEWRVHDHGQYLWDLGGGRFLLRVRNTLTSFAPLVGTGEERFEQRPFASAQGRLADVIVTQDKGVVALEVATGAPTHVLNNGDRQPPRFNDAAVSVLFLRIAPPAADGRVAYRVAGRLQLREPGDFALTSTGYMQMTEEAQDKWLFDYKPFAGKLMPLSGFVTSCDPFPVFVSGSEFVSFGCRGSLSNADLAGFNLQGEMMFQIDFPEAQSFPSIVSAPVAGRFAVSRGTTSSPVGPIVQQVDAQQVRVIQTYNGKQLLRVDCSPVQREGQNFTLAPDGMTLAVLHGGIEIYRLPPLTDEDKKAIADARAHDPAATTLDAAINLAENPASEAAAEPAHPAAAPAKPAAAVPAAAPANSQLPDAPRKPPTLYNPGEAPER